MWEWIDEIKNEDFGWVHLLKFFYSVGKSVDSYHYYDCRRSTDSNFL